jgi:hypothetical protein
MLPKAPATTEAKNQNSVATRTPIAAKTTTASLSYHLLGSTSKKSAIRHSDHTIATDRGTLFCNFCNNGKQHSNIFNTNY